MTIAGKVLRILFGAIGIMGGAMPALTDAQKIQESIAELISVLNEALEDNEINEDEVDEIKNVIKMLAALLK